MLKQLIACCTLVALMSSCEPLLEDSTETETTVLQTPVDIDSLLLDSTYLGQVLEYRIPGWITYQQQLNPEFNPSLLSAQDTSTYEPFVTEFYPDRTFREFYGDLMIYNTDSSRIIDLYSYRFAMEKDGRGTLRIHESPDTEISLLIPGHNVKERVMFMGPIGAFDHAFWADDRHMIVAGNADEDGNGLRKPIVWVINIRSKRVINFTYKGTLEQSARGYQLHRLRNRGMLESPPPAS
jgi:hypothetical protein